MTLKEQYKEELAKKKAERKETLKELKSQEFIDKYVEAYSEEGKTEEEVIAEAEDCRKAILYSYKTKKDIYSQEIEKLKKVISELK